MESSKAVRESSAKPANGSLKQEPMDEENMSTDFVALEPLSALALGPCSHSAENLYALVVAAGTLQ